MATGTSFKQQCPSCEAMVPIRDPGLIGRKIDCPKCKYRFIVEEPAGDEEEDAAPAKKKGDGKGDSKGGKAGAKAGPRRRAGGGGDDDGDRPAKKKQGGSNMVLLGGGLAGVAVIAIIIGAVVFLMGGDGGNKGGGTPPGGSVTSPPADASTTPAPADKGDKPAPSVLVNVSNLLPNDAQAVVAYPLSSTLGSGLKAAGVDEAEGGYKPERFSQMMGFGVEEIHRVLTALNAEKGWLFTIVQTKRPYKPQTLAAQLRLSEEPKIKGKSGKNHDVFLVNKDLDSIGNLLVKFNLPRETLQLYFLDANTIVFADPVPMRRFLEEDAKPEYLTKDAPPAAAGPAGGNPMGGMTPGNPMGVGTVPGNPMGGMGPGNPMGGGGLARMTPGTGSGPTGGMPMPGGGAPGAGGTRPAAAAPPPSSWMSVDPSLKLLLDRLEKLEDNRTTLRKEPVSVVTVVGLVAPLQPPIMAYVNQQIAEQELPLVQRLMAQQGVITLLRSLKTVGVTIAAFDQRANTASAAIEYHDSGNAGRQDKALRPLLALAPPLIKSSLGLNITITTPQQGGAMSGFPGGGFPGGFPGGGFPMGPMGPFGGGMVRPGGGGTGAGLEGPNPGGVGGPNGPTVEEKGDGTLELKLEDRVHVLTLDVQPPSEFYDKVLFPVTKVAMQWVKNQSDLASTRSHFHELASALKAYFDDKRQFPPGALHRSLSSDRGLPWRPDQRLSWVAALLPYLGEECREWKVDPEMGWNEGKNQQVATRVVLPLLAFRQAGPGPALITIPGIPDVQFAATHFVAISGLGLDAAEYKLGDPATAKKIGMFGYDRSTKKIDIKDGLDKTIALIMVPGDHKAPWLAGGGATVRAVSDDEADLRPLAPFVCITYPGKPGDSTKWDGKRGTLAIMADCRVRFLPEDLPAETFRALCTIAGGESIDKLDTLCPVIDAPEERVIKTTILAGLPGPRPGGGTTTPSAGSDQEKLQGAWAAVSVEVNGAKLPENLLKGGRFTISGTTVTAQMGGQSESDSFTIDPAKTPKTIDLVALDGPNKGKKQLGIYELNGADLKFCIAKSESPNRPTTFASPLGSDTQYVVLRRATGGATTTENKVAWKDYTPPSGAFSAKFPGEVGEIKQELPLPTGGKLTVSTFISQYGGTGGVCSASCIDLPPGSTANVEKELDLASRRVATAYGAGAKVKEEKKITLGTHTGREWTIEIAGKGVVKARVFVANNKLFELRAGPTPAMPEAEMKTFFDSFRIGK